MTQKFYIAAIDVFDVVEWPWGNAMTSYYDVEKAEEIFKKWSKCNKLTGLYKCFMPIVDGSVAYGEEIFIASFLDDAERAAASTSLAALKSLLANCSLDNIICEVEVDVTPNKFYEL